MSRVRLEEIKLAEFGVPSVRPEISGEIYRERIHRLRKRADSMGANAIIVYADREHSASISYLTGFEPRFEEALLVIAKDRDPLVITGPENQAYVRISPLSLDVTLYQPFGLLGQDRQKTPSLKDLLVRSGIEKGRAVGVIGWKYFGRLETETPETWLDAPSYIVDTLREIVGEFGKVFNATQIMMDSSHGMRAINEIDQIAQFEFSACHVSEGVKRVLFNAKPGMTEFEAAAHLRPPGIPLSCHTMLMTGDRTKLGLSSPTSRVMQKGDAFAVAFGLLGALTCRVAFLADGPDDLKAEIRDYAERLASPYFSCAAEWYETIGIGVAGGELDAIARRHLGDPFFGLILNPGHLIHLDEWMNTPIYPGSEERLQSGQTIQLDIIPATGSAYGSVNIEDGIALLDEKGRAAFREKYSDAWSRIEARRSFMGNHLGIKLKPEVLPLSNLAGYLSPFTLSPNLVFTKR